MNHQHTLPGNETNHVGFKWTPEAVETLTAMWQEGKSSAEIAACIGCSRCAVLGKANRIGLTTQYPHPSRPMHDTRAKPKLAIAPLSSLPSVKRSITLNHGDNAIRMRLRNGRKPVAASRRSKQPKLPPSPPAGTPVGVVDLIGCKWPVNNGDPVFLFCNAERCNERYCEFHENLSINPLRRVA